ncbi:MAG: 16S rRNA (cytidine(1402)-2'-O)-methyltransferase [Nitrosomonadales bacterium]|jgi:16S rRNA (cytidine1402-2'-O)-methyltransferase|nr:16S rRNA (cytidine(1402)-2'-O)-methyltransferase [Nitrosomonadales bacterium]MBT3918222.1 16S rRNA (cytidine(1402)-2'-O)-methyltransferase [Nitrosomonadales bacterium]MBT4571602.1 16S rRNA (cytidine(1402)-2'-O)-methyltransferase [Nitrosomonadales bacterium]MBT5150360.1 16S rRNA (cytidine(1402)-2'-O)-methyltransferase [Nitrosomonadales bacterium]MBT5573080.1 16S rRNA (cytidine(1402)-2'-O)-methyltransferase [Nitrosomonadales bacterium]
MNSALYIVGTPIGNLDDITSRAIEILNSVDLIACEDTRHSKHLLSKFSINKKLISLHQHNEEGKSSFLIKEIQNGKKIAYISDAGTPGISDPGAYLVKKALEAKIKVVPIPGASSITAAFSVAGITSTQFKFYGFLPNTDSRSKKVIKQFYKSQFTSVFFVSPHRILKTLELLEGVYGANQNIFIGRELTKLYETVYKENLHDLLLKFRNEKHNLKGEFVIIIEGIEQEHKGSRNLGVENALKIMLNELSLNQSVKLVSQIFKMKKNEIYNLALEIKNNDK